MPLRLLNYPLSWFAQVDAHQVHPCSKLAQEYLVVLSLNAIKSCFSMISFELWLAMDASGAFSYYPFVEKGSLQHKSKIHLVIDYNQCIMWILTMHSVQNIF